MCRIIRLFLYTFITIHAVISIEATQYYYLNETKHEAMGQRQRTEDHGKVIFVSLFFLAVIHSKCKHALQKELTILKCSMDDLELFYEQCRKNAIAVEWILPVKHRTQNQ